MAEIVNTARIPVHVFAPMDAIQPDCITQAENVANLPVSFHHVALMPDAHVGYGIPVGGVAAIENALIPYAVGNDIGCGVATCSLGVNARDVRRGDLGRLLDNVSSRVPVGPKTRKRPLKSRLFSNLPNLPVVLANRDRAERQLGTLGSGNHFIEFQADEEGWMWVMIHSGSRNVGLRVCTHYSRRAKSRRKRDRSAKRLRDANLSWLELGDGSDGDSYLAEMSFCQDYARENRRLMMDEILRAARQVLGKISEGERVDIHHNYAEKETHYGKEVWVHRKGAVRAETGDTVLVPGSMATASYVGRGLGLAESFRSSAHGAGRKMGRGQSKRAFTPQQVVREMDRLNIVHKATKSGLVEESGWSYKDVDMVMSSQSELVAPVRRLRPVAVLKG